MRRLALLLLFASPLVAQTVTNGSFEASPPTGNYDYRCPQGWTCKGQYWGMQNPTVAQLPVVPDGKTVLWMQGATATQDLGPSDTTKNYTLTYFVGSQSSFPAPKSYSVSLGIPCTTSGAGPTTAGVMVQQTLTCTGTGELLLTLTAGGSQAMFDNVVLTSTPTGPPQLINVTINAAGLFWCAAKCDGTDNTPIAGSVLISQQKTSAAFGINPDGSVSVNGAIDVSVNPVTFTFTLLDANNTPVPGISLTWQVPNSYLQSTPGFLLGTLPIPPLMLLKGTDASGNPIVTFKGFVPPAPPAALAAKTAAKAKTP